jgi:hypothetical protein
MAARKEMTDWSHYEALLPKPSHSNVGRYVDCSHDTIPQVRSYLRSEGAADMYLSSVNIYWEDFYLYIWVHLRVKNKIK